MTPRGNGDVESQGVDLLKKPKYKPDEIPSNVSSEEQLIKLPIEYLSENPAKPLQHVGSKATDQVQEYALNPLKYSVIFILLVELLERFAFYGINYTQTAYLTGSYNRDWNSGMSSVEASSLVSISTAIAYTAPFIGALLADCVLGDYWVIILGMAVLYTPGLELIQLTTIPHLFGDQFPTSLLNFGLLLLWPVGAGMIKSVVNIFGAKQYHPVLQTALIETYYVNFYMCINVGALVGGIVVPVVAQHDIIKAYAIPVAMLSAGLLIFVSFNGRYVRRKPQGDLLQALGALRALVSCTNGVENTYASVCSADNTINKSVDFLEDPRGFLRGPAYQAQQLRRVMMISALIIPFNVAYSQMATAFILQGTVMKTALYGTIDAAMINNCDAISVLICGFVVGTYFYPALAARDIKIFTTYKFALGSFCGMMAIAWALFLEYRIHAKYQATGEKVNVLWLSFSYFLIGAGEVFAISAAYEVAFAVAPKSQKALSSAINLFCIGGLPNLVCMGLYQLCSKWFMNAEGNANIENIHEYSEAQVYNYYWVLLLIALFGTLVNMIPAVRDWVANVEQEAVQRKLFQAAEGDGKTSARKGLSKLLKEQRSTSMTAATSDEDAVSEQLVGSMTTIKLNAQHGPKNKVIPPDIPRPPVIGTPNKVSFRVKRSPKVKSARRSTREFVLLNRFGSQYGSTDVYR